jgi:carboxyl-terminal processing protease
MMKMNSKVKVCKIKTAVAAFVFCLNAGATPTDSNTQLNKNDRYKNLELFQKVLQFVEKNYVADTKNDDLVHGAIKGMLETLDPHSNFLSPEVYRDMKIETTGKFGGIGIEVGIKDDVLTVISPMEDSPAWKAGIKPNDKIVRINGESTKGFTMAEAVARMHGKNGSQVTLTIYRKGWSQFKDLSLRREIIKVRSVKSERVEEGYGYIRLYSFNESAAVDVKKAIEQLEKSKPLQGLVFDLRTNPGGLLDQAVEVASLFVDEGIIVSTMGRDPTQKEIRYAKKGMARKDLPVVVLVNSSTASAAEIVAAAIQDHHRGMILGDTTFGKGSVQSIIELGQDMGLKLTIANYYTPNGASIQEKGVTPDIFLDEYDPKLLAQAKVKRDATRERDLRGHLVNPQTDPKKKTPVPGAKSNSSRDEFSIQEFNQTQSKLKNKKGDSELIEEEDGTDMSPIQFNPKDDYQVLEAMKYLKSYDVFKRLKK